VNALMPFLVLTLPLLAVDTSDTRMLREPAVSKDHIAFMYDDDLWVANIDGTGAHRLTTHPGTETQPRFSPDGTTIAFTAEYGGNQDIYIVDVRGGSPRRMTWHPAQDAVRDFTPDGSAILMSSSRYNFAGRNEPTLYLLPVSEGMPKSLGMPLGHMASLSPDGKRVAYTPMPEPHRQWKNYRGGLTTRIWISDLDDLSVTEIPKGEAGSNDASPMWIGDKIYFDSDRAGERNLFSYDPATGAIEQLTRFDEYPVLNPADGAGKIIYEHAGSLRLYDVAAETDTRLTLAVASDLNEARPRYEQAVDHLRHLSLAPTGKRVLAEMRGEVFSLPVEKGDPVNLTQSPGAHEREPVWSPDGRYQAWLSDVSGEYALYLKTRGEEGEPRAIALEGGGFYDDLAFSPDSEKIAYLDNQMAIYILDIASGTCTEVARETEYGPPIFITPSFSWSPDSKWLAYDRRPEGLIRSVYLYELASGRSTMVSDGLSEVSNPVFDRGGEYLYFFASTDAGPVADWFSLFSADMEVSNTVFMAVLSKKTASPLARENDEEPLPEPEEAEEPEPKKKKGKKDEKAADGKEADKGPTVEIDFDDLDRRIIALDTPAGSNRQLTAGENGTIFYLHVQASPAGGLGQPAELHRYTLASRKATPVISGIADYTLSGDGKKIAYAAGPRIGVIDAGAKGANPGDGMLALDGVRVRIDPREEWPQILREAWRINRDYFYAANYHGVDWDAMYEKYAGFVAHCATRADLNRVIRWMCSELAVGHHRNPGGERLVDPEQIPIGLLGADFAIDSGRYRFEKVYGGPSWNPNIRAPLTEPGATVEAGEYLLAVNGVDLAPPDNIYARFVHSAGHAVRLTVGPDPGGEGSREVTVVPIADDDQLRRMDWVEGNIDRVTEATNGRAGYVFVPNTGGGGHAYFKRYFYPQSHREAVIIDDRWNAGGLIADYVIDHLRRPLLSYWATPYGRDIPQPKVAVQGPKVMLINERSSSGGDMLPWMFDKLDLGTLVGKRTWGGLVGVMGFPVLMDGGTVTAPNIAIWTPEEGWVVENVGVPPHIDVELDPVAYMEGRDAQLEKAIEVIMDQLPPEPPSLPDRPPYPVRNQ